MDVDPEELAKTYSEYTDEKLLSMASSGALTEIANNILEKELSHRGIAIPQQKIEFSSTRLRRINRPSIVSGVSGALLIGAWIVYFILLEIYPPPPPYKSPAYSPIFFHAVVFIAVAVLVLLPTALIAGLTGLIETVKLKKNERGFIPAIFGLAVVILHVLLIYITP